MTQHSGNCHLLRAIFAESVVEAPTVELLNEFQYTHKQACGLHPCLIQAGLKWPGPSGGGNSKDSRS